jgi:Na+-translocating ferredoxin:NAD+ oxidoreductase RnfD subunit
VADAVAGASRDRGAIDNARRFFRTPKGLVTLILPVLLIPATAGAGARLVTPIVAAAVLTAMAVDAPLLRVREGEWQFPDGAFLTGLFVAMILSPHERWYVAAITSAIAVVSKYAFRARNANVFNPAAFALVVTFYMFRTGQSWWGALPELPTPWIFLLFATGVFITRRVNKAPAVISFLGVYYALFTVTSFVVDPARVVGLYRAPDVHAALFFAFFMVTDPPTSPPKQKQQWIFGAITAVVAFAIFELLGWVYFLLAGLLVANLWEAWRRSRTRRQ